MATVGVLCARVRVEEKQLMAALAEAGALPTPLPPADVPLPVGPPLASSVGPYGATGAGGGALGARIIVDRCQDRAVAAAILTVCRGLGATTLDAGLAATGDRLAVAGGLAAAGLPRPETRLACSAAAALGALGELGYPGTLLPLLAGSAAVALLDEDTAEAVVEHREVLGSTRQALALVQAGAPDPSARALVVVVDGRAVAVGYLGPTSAGGAQPSPLPVAALRLAEAAAAALGAVVVGIEVALTRHGPVVWDVQAVPEYRHSVPLGSATVATTVAAAAMARLGSENVPAAGRERVTEVQLALGESQRGWERDRRPAGREVGDGVALSA